jgi:hypothetical protein
MILMGRAGKLDASCAHAVAVGPPNVYSAAMAAAPKNRRVVFMLVSW